MCSKYSEREESKEDIKKHSLISIKCDNLGAWVKVRDTCIGIVVLRDTVHYGLTSQSMNQSQHRSGNYGFVNERD